MAVAGKTGHLRQHSFACQPGAAPDLSGKISNAFLIHLVFDALRLWDRSGLRPVSYLSISIFSANQL